MIYIIFTRAERASSALLAALSQCYSLQSSPFVYYQYCCRYYITNPIIAAMLSINETRPSSNWFPKEAAAASVVVDPTVSAAAVAPAELVASAAARLESVLLALLDDDVDVDFAVALEAKPGIFQLARDHPPKGARAEQQKSIPIRD